MTPAYSSWPAAGEAYPGPPSAAAAAWQASGIVAALPSGCASDLQPCPAVRQTAAGSSDPGTVALGWRTEGSYRRRLVPSCHVVHRIGMLAAVHGDASFPATEGDPFRSLKPRKTKNRKNPSCNNKQTKPIEWLGFSKSKQIFRMKPH